MKRRLTNADSRPRVHIWPHVRGAAWSIGPTGLQTLVESSPGAALDNAIANTRIDPAQGIVVIIETPGGWASRAIEGGP